MSDLARQVKSRLDLLKSAGIEYVPRNRKHQPSENISTQNNETNHTERIIVSDTSSLFSDTHTISDEPFTRQSALVQLAQEVAGCSRCTELFATRTQTVFGVGPLDPELCFVGEAPGADEDRLGEPFVGAAGQLLNKIIAACGLKREEVYICNTIKCRPPNNREPTSNEKANCREYFDRQIDIVRPKLICCLGGVAAKWLLNTSLGITKLRGKWQIYRGIPVMCTYHPSYLLRQTGAAQQKAKSECWEDMKLVLQRMGRPIPKTKSGG